MNKKTILKYYYKLISWFVILAFLTNMAVPASAQTLSFLPAPGTMVTLTPSFSPVLLRGVRVNPKNPFELDFIVDVGDTNLNDKEFTQESEKLIKYFLASLTIPEEDLWVNLSPYEEDRIIPDAFSQTEMGRDLLAQDYILKQITASLVYPEDELGKRFWDRIYKEAFEKYGTTQIPVNTFNKVWIVPEKAVVYENGPRAFVVKSHLKVMLEEDYLSLENNLDNQKIGAQLDNENETKQTSNFSSQIVREIVLPEIEKEVNQGKNFANLRQVYNSLILATWFKNTLKNSVLNQKYSNQAKISGVDVDDKEIREKIYRQYLDAFKKGVCDFVKVEYDKHENRRVPRKYFSGGMSFLGNTRDAIVPEDRILEVTKSCSPAKLRRISSVLEFSKKTAQDYLLSRQREYTAYRGIKNYDWWLNQVDLRFKKAQAKNPLALFLKRFASEAHRIARGRPLRVLDAGCGAGMALTEILEEHGNKSLDEYRQEISSRKENVDSIRRVKSEKTFEPENVEVFGADLNNINSETMTLDGRARFLAMHPGKDVDDYLKSEKPFIFKQEDIKTVRFFDDKGNSIKMDLIISMFVAQYDEDPIAIWLNLFNKNLALDGTFNFEMTFPNTDKGKKVIEFYRKVFEEMKRLGVADIRIRTIDVKDDSKKDAQEIAMFVSSVKTTEQEVSVNADPMTPDPVKIIFEEQDRDYEYILVDYKAKRDSSLVSVSSSQLLNKADEVFFDNVYQGIRTYLKTIQTAIWSTVLARKDKKMRIFGIGPTTSKILQEILKYSQGENIEFLSNDFLAGAGVDFNNMKFVEGKVLDENDNPIRADKVISLIDCRSSEKDVAPYFNQFILAHNNVNNGGSLFSVFTFLNNDESQRKIEIVKGLLAEMENAGMDIDILDPEIAIKDAEPTRVILVRVKKKQEREIRIKDVSGNLEVDVIDGVSPILTGDILDNMYSVIPLAGLNPAVRSSINDINGIDFNPSDYEILGVKALVDKTGKTVFFSRDGREKILRHTDVARQYFGGASGDIPGDIIGYQLQFVRNKNTGEKIFAGFQIDSKLANMPELYDPKLDGRAITENEIIKGPNQFLLDNILIPHNFSPEQALVQEDFLSNISEIETIPGKDGKDPIYVMSTLKAFGPSPEIESKVFANQDNRLFLGKLFKEYVLFYNENVRLNPKLNLEKDDAKVKAKKRDDFLELEFQKFSGMIAYLILKSFFSETQERRTEFNNSLKSFNDFVEIQKRIKIQRGSGLNPGSDLIEVRDELAKRVIKILKDEFLSGIFEDFNKTHLDIKSLISDPGFVPELNLSKSVRGKMDHGIKLVFNILPGFLDIVAEEIDDPSLLDSEDGDDDLLSMALNKILLARKYYHFISNRKPFNVFFEDQEGQHEALLLDSSSNPKEVLQYLLFSKELDKLERFTTTWPTALEKDEYLFTMNNVSKEELENEKVLLAIHFKVIDMSVLVSGDQKGAVSYLKDDQTKKSKVVYVQDLFVDPSQGRTNSWKRAYVLLLEHLDTVFNGQEFSIVFEPKSKKEADHAKNIFNAYKVPGSKPNQWTMTVSRKNRKIFDGQWGSGITKIKEIAPRGNLSAVVGGGFVFTGEVKKEEEAVVKSELIPGEIVIKNRGTSDPGKTGVITFTYNGKWHVLGKGQIQRLDLGSAIVLSDKEFDEMYPQVVAALDKAVPPKLKKGSSNMGNYWTVEQFKQLADVTANRYLVSGDYDWNQCQLASDDIMRNYYGNTELMTNHKFEKMDFYIPVDAQNIAEGMKTSNHVVVIADGWYVFDTQLRQFKKRSNLSQDNEFFKKFIYTWDEYFENVPAFFSKTVDFKSKVKTSSSAVTNAQIEKVNEFFKGARSGSFRNAVVFHESSVDFAQALNQSYPNSFGEHIGIDLNDPYWSRSFDKEISEKEKQIGSNKQVFIPLTVKGEIKDYKSFGDFLLSQVEATFGKVQFVLILDKEEDFNIFERMIRTDNSGDSNNSQFIWELVGSKGFFDLSDSQKSDSATHILTLVGEQAAGTDFAAGTSQEATGASDVDLSERIKIEKAEEEGLGRKFASQELDVEVVQVLAKIIEPRFHDIMRKYNLTQRHPGLGADIVICWYTSQVLARFFSKAMDIPIGGNSPNRIEIPSGLYLDDKAPEARSQASHLWGVIYLNDKPTVYFDGGFWMGGGSELGPYSDKIIVMPYQEAMKKFGLLKLDDAIEASAREYGLEMSYVNQYKGPEGQEPGYLDSEDVGIPALGLANKYWQLLDIQGGGRKVFSSDEQGKFDLVLQELFNISSLSDIPTSSALLQKDTSISGNVDVDADSKAKTSSSNLGGIDLGADTMNMEIQSEGEGFEFNFNEADFMNIEINGLYPVIINIAPVINLPAFLGAVQESDKNLQLS